MRAKFFAMTQATPAVDPRAIVASFQYYLRREGGLAKRAEFIDLLEAHLADRGFLSDMDSLLRSGLEYDPRQAGDCVKKKLLSLLPE